MNDRTETLVLGAGPAGLSCTLSLQRAGARATLVEKAPFVGGLSRTVTRDGFRFDLGGHRFFTKNQEVLGFVKGLFDEPLLEVSRLSRIHFRGRYVDYPIRPLNALRNVGVGTSLKIARDLVGIMVRGETDEPKSLADWMTASYGKTLFETYFRVYAEKVWGMPASRIHADLAAQRVKGLDLRDMLRHALFRNGNGNGTGDSLVERFYYPRLGFGEICDRMAASLDPAGSLLLRTRPVRITDDGKRIREVELANGDGPRSILRPNHLISSIPITSLVPLFEPAAPEEVREAAASLGFRAVVFVTVFLDVPNVRPESWIYFPSPEISFGRVTEPRNWSEAMSPEGKTSIVAEHFCDVGDETWDATDASLVARTVDDLAGKLEFFDPGQVMGASVIRVPRAYPRMDVDHKDALSVIEGFLDRFENLQLIGRGGMYRYHNADHAIETGLAAASNVLGGEVDLRAINSDLDYHETR